MRKIAVLLCSGIACMALAATARADTLALKDGTRHDGEFVSGTPRTITFREQGRLMSYSKDSVDWLQFTAPDQDFGNNSPDTDRRDARPENPNQDFGNNTSDTDRRDARPENPRPPDDRNAEADRLRELRVIPAGTELVIRTNEEIDSERARTDQTFSAQIDQDVLDDSGQTIIPRGSDAQLMIRRIKTEGVSTSEMLLDVDAVMIAGRSYAVDTSDVAAKGTSGLGKNKRTGELVGGGTLFGAIIGAIAGGGKGAAIGAVSGAAAGATVQVLTKGSRVRVPAETVLNFKLDQPVHLHLRPDNGDDR